MAISLSTRRACPSTRLVQLRPPARTLTRRQRVKVVSQEVADLKKGIANFYDKSSGLWEEIWGEHMHHGYYPKGSPPKTNQQAQVDLIDATLQWCGVEKITKMLDVGCGVGGSSRYIARRYGCSATGITLSPYQAERANVISKEVGLSNCVSFQVADALATPFPNASFDFIWSMESGEHMPDKPRFVKELVRLCMPGGRVVVVTWCHRVLGQDEAKLEPKEQELLEKICEAYYLPAWCSVEDYRKLFEAEGLVDIKTADWSESIAPFWGEVIKSALTPRGVLGLLQAGWTTIKGALVMPLMSQGYREGVIKFVLITGRKP